MKHPMTSSRKALDTLRSSILPDPATRAEQVTLVYRQSRESMLLSLAAAWILASLVVSDAPAGPLAAWLATISVILLVRLWLSHRINTEDDGARAGQHTALLLVSVAVTGLAWGVSGMFLPNTSPAAGIAIVLVVTVIAVSAMAFLAQYLPSYLVFLLSAKLPMIYFVSVSLEDLVLTPLLLHLLFLLAAAITAVRFNLVISERIRLRSEADDLNRQLAAKNHELEAELVQRQQAQEELTRNKAYIDSIFANAPVEMYLKDHEGRYIKINRQFERIFGIRDSDAHGKLPFDVHDAELAARTYEHDMSVLASGETQVMEQPCRLPGVDDDEMHTLLTIKFPVKTEDGTINGLGAVVFDITHQKNIENELRLSRERFRDFAEVASDFYWETDASMTLTFASEHGQVLNGVPMGELVASTDGILAAGRVLIDKAWRDHLALRREQRAYELETSFLRNDDKEVRIHISARPVTNAAGEFFGYRGVTRDVTREYRLRQDFAHQANHDPLTGQYNRRKFLACIDELLEDVRGSSRVHLLCYLDLDRFKFVNDSGGHIAGDALLVEVSNVIRKHIRPQDVLGRIGGDEFGIALRNCSTSRGSSIANQVIRGLQEIDFHWNARRYAISASIGISVIDAGVTSATTVLGDADQACYRAKELGEGRVFVSSRTGEGDGEALRGQSYRHTDWLDAFDKSMIQLYAQPILPLRDDGGISRWYELLIRLVDQAGNAHSPEYFIPYAERFGQIVRVDQWVVSRAFERIQEIDGWRECCFSINLSGASLHSDRLRRDILDHFGTDGIRPENVCFEITETSAIRNLSLARTFIERLRGEGCHVALDDFGTGLASFSYLKHFPVDFVKIDGSFIEDLASDPYNPVFVESICSVARAMNIRTVGECVESAEYLDRLADIGVDFAQGNAIGTPVPLAALRQPAAG